MSLKIKALNGTIVLMLSWLGLFFGYLMGSFFVLRESGLAGVALLFWCGVGGLIVFLILGVVLVRKTHIKIRTKLFWILLTISGLLAGWLAFRFYQVNGKKKTILIVPKVNPKSKAWNVYFASYPQQENVQPIGLGVASVEFNKDNLLYFYPSYTSEKPVDSITFSIIHNQVNIQTAPPWLVPEYIKMDYETLLFRVTSEAKTMLEVIVNKQTGRRLWVKKDALNFNYWPKFLLNCSSLKPLNSAQNPIRIKPLDHASVVSHIPNEPFRPITISQDWILVGIKVSEEQPQPLGWLRWKNQTEILITISIFE